MQAISKAILVTFNADATLKAALTGGLYDTEAPQTTTHPYGVFQLTGSVDDLTFSDTKETHMIQFKIYSNNSGSCASLDIVLAALLATYNFCQLTIIGQTFVRMQKRSISKTKTDGVWEYLVLFEIMSVVNRI